MRSKRSDPKFGVLLGRFTRGTRRENPRLVDVADPCLLAALLAAKIDREFGGNLNAAAKAAGISQPTLHRWTRGEVAPGTHDSGSTGNRISRNVQKHIGRFLGQENSLNAFVSPDAAEALHHYESWNARVEALALSDSFREQGMPLNSPDGPAWGGREKEYWSLWNRVKKEVPHVFLEITGLIESGLRRMNSRAREKGWNESQKRRSLRSDIGPMRFKTAIVRILLPLLEVRESGWIERRGAELSRDEFRRFVEHGWERERIVLRRDGDLQRAQRLSTLAALARSAGPRLSSRPKSNTPP